VQHRVDPGGRFVAALALEPLEVVPVADQRFRRRVVPERTRLLEQRQLEREQVSQPARRSLPHRRRIAEIAMLLEERNADTRLSHDSPSRRHEVPGDEAKKGRLPSTVPTDDPPALSRADGERDITKEQHGAEFDGHVRDLELRHERILPCRTWGTAAACRLIGRSIAATPPRPSRP